MKTLSLLKNKLSLTLLTLACGLVTQSAMAGTVNQMKDKDFIRVTAPEADMADLRLVYVIDGEKVEATAKGGDVIKLHAEGNNILGIQSFSAVRESETSYNLQMGLTSPIGLDHIIGFSSTGESSAYEDDAPIYINGTNVTVEVVTGGNIDEIINEAPKPIVIGDESQDFSKVGFLEVRFVVRSPGVDQGNDQGNGDDDGGQDNGNAASGGCSMVTDAANASTLSFASFAMLSALSLTLRRRAQKK